MNIQKDSVVRFHYTVSDADSGELESSRGGDALAILVGYGNIIPGLEDAMQGKAAGDQFDVVIAPEQAYGQRIDNAVQRIPRKHFKNVALKPGMQVVVPTSMGPRPVTVQKVGMSVVDVDLNHPMAGKTLKFDVEIVEVREASDDEKAHGHVHGEGGVQH